MRIASILGLMTLVLGCAVAGPPVTPATQPAPGRVGFLPGRCEQPLDGLYETVVASVMDKLGSRYVLTVPCDGTHRIYLKPSPSIDFAPLVGRRVCARYRYVEEIIPRAPCVRAPCPDVVETVLDIVDIRPASGTGCRDG